MLIAEVQSVGPHELRSSLHSTATACISTRHVGRMGETDIPSKYLVAGAISAGSSARINNASQTGLHSRRVRGPQVAWGTAVWMVFSIAVIFLIMKCASRLAIHKNASISARMLAQGGRKKKEHRTSLLGSVRIICILCSVDALTLKQ